MGSKLQVRGDDAETTPTVNVENADRRQPIARRVEEEAISREQIFEILSNERRRLVLRYLREHRGDDPIGFRDIVDQVTAWENDMPKETLDSSDRKCVYTALRQTHLPKLARCGVVEFDNQRGVLRPKENLDEVLLYMRHDPEREVFWTRLSLLMAVSGGLFALSVWIGIVPFGGVPRIAVAVGIALVLSTVSIAQIYLAYRHGARFDESHWN